MHWSPDPRYFIKTVLIGLLVFMPYANFFSQTPQWQWARTLGGKKAENAYSSAMDPSGNVITAGYFYSDTVVAGTQTLVNNGNYDILIAKYDASGNLLWCRNGGGMYDDVALSVCTDKNSNIFVTGYFYSPYLHFSADTIFNKGAGDGFVMKYDPQGNLDWLRGIGGTGDESGMGLCIKTNDNIALCGWFQSDTLKLGNVSATSKGGDDCFLTELSQQGSFLLLRAYGDSGSEIASCISADDEDNILFAGHFSSLSFSIGSDVLASSGNSDYFLVKTDPYGTPIWARKGGGAFSDQASAITVDRFNHVTICGTFLSSTLVAGSVSVTNNGAFDYYVSSYDRNGNLLWLRSEGGMFDENAYGIVSDWAGNNIVTGHFHSPSAIIGNDTLSNHGIGDLYLTCYDSTGIWKWTEQLGGAADDGSSGLCTDGAGIICISGYLISPNIICPQFTIGSSGSEDCLLAKLSMPLIFTGLSENAEEKSFSCFPNPTKEKIYFSCKEQIEIAIVYDLQGRLVQQKQVDGFAGEIDLPKHAPGLYILEVRSQSKHHLKKLIVE